MQLSSYNKACREKYQWQNKYLGGFCYLDITISCKALIILPLCSDSPKSCGRLVSGITMLF